MISNSDMIIDRTQEDLNSAIFIRDNLVKKFQTLSNEQIKTMERGTMTCNTLNRIEQKQEELKRLINPMGYWNTNIAHKTDWTVGDIFTEADYQRIIDNENVLRKAFFTYSDTPETPLISFHYDDLNALEKILVDLDVMINDVKSNYRQCGAFTCGEE